VRLTKRRSMLRGTELLSNTVLIPAKMSQHVEEPQTPRDQGGLFAFYWPTLVALRCTRNSGFL
jgi:hypothetical protein